MLPLFRFAELQTEAELLRSLFYRAVGMLVKLLLLNELYYRHLLSVRSNYLLCKSLQIFNLLGTELVLYIQYLKAHPHAQANSNY